MNKADLVYELAMKLDIPQYKSQQFLNAFEEVLTEALGKDDSLRLQGFGSFEPWEQAERLGRNPRTGVSCLIPSRVSVKFKPGKLLLEALNTPKNNV